MDNNSLKALLGRHLDPDIKKRAALLPMGINQEGETELAAPEIMLSLARSLMLPGHVAQGGEFTEHDVTEMAGNVAGVGGGAGLLGGAPAGALAMGAARPPRWHNMPPLQQSLYARGDAMDTPKAQRTQPRPDRQPIVEHDLAAYQQPNPMAGGEDLMKTLPRQEAGKALPLGDRARPIIDNMEAIAQELAKRAGGQLGTETQFFYHTGPIYQAARKYGLTDDEARLFITDFANRYAALSPRTKTDDNLRNASMIMAKEKAGIPYDQIVGPNAGQGRNERGYAMIINQKGDLNAEGNPARGDGLHRILMDTLQRDGKINLNTNTKPATFSSNVAGNLSAPTIDTHAIRGVLDAMNGLKPGSIPDAWIAKKFRAQYKKDPSSFDAATWVVDTLGSAKVGPRGASTKKQVEYAPFADIYARMGEIMNVSPAEAQSMGWFGSGAKTGLDSEAKTIATLIDERIDVTAQQMNISPEQAAELFFRREIALSMNGNPALAAAVGQRRQEEQKQRTLEAWLRSGKGA